MEQYLAQATSVTSAPGSDPPDYWFTVGGIRYAVEVTRLVQQQGRHSRYGSQAVLERWVKELSRAAINRNDLVGRYALFLDHKVAESPHQVRRALRLQLLELLHQTRHLPVFHLRSLLTVDPWLARISKHSGEGASISLVTTGFTAWGADVEVNTRSILQRALATKRKKLAGVQEPLVLVLLNGYLLADAQTYERVMEDLDLKFFAGVYLIHSDECTPLKPMPLEP